MRYLLDSNVLSEGTKPRPDKRVEVFMRSSPAADLAISVISIGEIVRGIELLPVSRKRVDLQAWLDGVIRPGFEGRILPITNAIAARWGRLQALHERTGHAIDAIDLLLAATALEHEIVMVTRNVSDFVAPELRVFDPWAG